MSYSSSTCLKVIKATTPPLDAEQVESLDREEAARNRKDKKAGITIRRATLPPIRVDGPITVQQHTAVTVGAQAVRIPGKAKPAKKPESDEEELGVYF